MKIIETNSEQWEIKESGVAAAIIGAILIAGGVVSLGWVVMNLATLDWWWTLVSLGVVGIGVAVVFTASNRQITLRRQGMSEVVATRLIGGKRTGVSFDRSQIVSVNLITTDEARTSNSGNGPTTTYERVSRLYLLLKDNSQVPLATSQRGSSGISVNGISLSGINKAPLSDEAQRIAAFYGVPLSSRADNVGAVEMISGIAGAVQQGISGATQSSTTATVAQPATAPTSSIPVPPVPPVIPQAQSVATPVPGVVESSGQPPR